MWLPLFISVNVIPYWELYSLTLSSLFWNLYPFSYRTDTSAVWASWYSTTAENLTSPSLLNSHLTKGPMHSNSCLTWSSVAWEYIFLTSTFVYDDLFIFIINLNVVRSVCPFENRKCNTHANNNSLQYYCNHWTGN